MVEHLSSNGENRLFFADTDVMSASRISHDWHTVCLNEPSPLREHKLGVLKFSQAGFTSRLLPLGEPERHDDEMEKRPTESTPFGDRTAR